MFLVTQEARDAQNAAMKTAPAAAGASPVHGVPSAAEGVAGHAGEAARGGPGPLVPPGGAGVAHRGDVRAEDFRRPYIAAGHAADSPTNAPATVGRHL